MKRFKRWFLALLLGEFLTLFKKDPAFKQWVLEKKGFEKVKHVFDGLFDFNKQLVEEVKEQFDTQALEKHLHEWVAWVEREYGSLVEELQPLKVKWATVTHELLVQLQARFDAFSHTALLIKDQISTFNVQEKIAELKKTLENLAKPTKSQ